MVLIAPLWLILIVLALTHPIKALKYGFSSLSYSWTSRSVM